jgi:hypothetical protein
MNISALLYQCQTFWLLKMWLWSCSLLTNLAWSVIIFLVSDHESGAKRTPCPWCFWHSWTLTWRPKCDPRKSFPAVFPAVAERLLSIALFWRGPIWRGQLGPINLNISLSTVGAFGDPRNIVIQGGRNFGWSMLKTFTLVSLQLSTNSSHRHNKVSLPTV